MTEQTVDRDEIFTVETIPFIVALALAPLVLGAPAWGYMMLADEFNLNISFLSFIAVFPAAALPFGTPSYLVFGAPAFWLAIRHGTSTSAAGQAANVVSVPFVVLFFFVFIERAQIESILVIYLFFGSIFAAAWGGIFGTIYRWLAKERTNA